MNIFTRLLKLYKTNSDKTPKEDFTTEIFVGILEKDSELLDDYVNNFLKIEGEGFEVFSQCCYTLNTPNDCRIDMVIENDEKLIFVENKVDSLEGEGQLDKYSNYLKQIEDKESHLCYCTKVMEEKEVGFSNFNYFRWKDIYDYYEDSDIELMVEFLEYLEEEGIVMNKKFNFTDMVVMENIVETISKMDEVLNETSKHLEKNFGKCIKHSGRSTQIERNNVYSSYTTYVLNGNGYTDICATFNFNKNEYEVPHLELKLMVEKSSEYFNKFKDIIDNEKLSDELEGYVYSNGINIWIAEPIQDFLSSETQIEDMKYWFKEQIEIMAKFKNKTPDFGWK